MGLIQMQGGGNDDQQEAQKSPGVRLNAGQTGSLNSFHGRVFASGSLADFRQTVRLSLARPS